MSESKIPEFDLDKLLPSIKIHPFPIIKHTAFYRSEATLECPTCLARDDFYNPRKTAIFDAQYCKGSMPAEIECQGPFGSHKHEVTCSGVTVPHFHVACQICGERHLLAIPEKTWVEL